MEISDFTIIDPVLNEDEWFKRRSRERKSANNLYSPVQPVPTAQPHVPLAMPQATLNTQVLPKSVIDTPRLKRAGAISDQHTSDMYQQQRQRAQENWWRDNSVYITDPRTINPINGEQLDPNTALKSGRYNKNTIRTLAKKAQENGLDPYEVVAVALQESLLGQTDENIGHVISNPAGATNNYDALVKNLKYASDTYRDTWKLAGVDEIPPEMEDYYRLQAYNGTGILTPDTEKDYHGGSVQAFYGIPVSKENPLSMKDTQAYGRWVSSIKDYLKQDPDVQGLIKEVIPDMSCGGKIEKYPKMEAGGIVAIRPIKGQPHKEGGVDMERNGLEFEAEGGEYEALLEDGTVVIFNAQQKAALDQGVPLQEILKTMPEYTPKAYQGIIIDPDERERLMREKANMMPFQERYSLSPLPMQQSDIMQPEQMQQTAPLGSYAYQPILTPPPPMGFPQGQTMQQAAIEQTAPQGNPVINAMKSAAIPPSQQAAQAPGEDTLEGYIKLLSQYLQKPELDAKRQKRLQNAALINSIGNAMTNAVNYMGAERGAPVIKTDNRYVFQPLAESMKQDEMYQQRLDRYNQANVQNMWNAVQMARQDKRMIAEDKWKEKEYQYRADKDTKEEGRWQQNFDLEKEYKEWQKKYYGGKETQDQLNFEAQLKENARQFNAQNKRMTDADAKDYALKVSKILQDEMKVAGENVPVVDQNTGKNLIIPKDIYFDIYSKIMTNPSSEIEKELVSLVGADYETSKNIINGMIAAEYRRFYEPQYDAAGNFQGWQMKPGAQQGSFMTQPPGTAPLTNPAPTNVPTYFN